MQSIKDVLINLLIEIVNFHTKKNFAAMKEENIYFDCKCRTIELFFLFDIA